MDQVPHEQLDDDEDLPEDFDYSPVLISTAAQTQLPVKGGYLTPQQFPILLVVLTTLINGLVLTFQPLFQRLASHPKLFNMMVPYGIYHWSRSLSVAFGVMLVYLALNLYHRKKTSWYIATLALVLSLVIHLARAVMEGLSPTDADSALVALSVCSCVVNIVLLLVYRHRFTVRSEPRDIWRGFSFFAITLVLAVAYGVIGFRLLAVHDFGMQFQWQDAIERTIREFTLIGNEDLTPHTRYAVWFLESLRFAGGMAGAFALFSLFRPIEYQLRTRPVERALMASILEQHGHDALDNYKLLPDKSYVFADSKQCAAAYRTTLDVAIHLGDIVGADEELPDFLRAYINMCHTNGWSVAFMQVTDRWLDLYKQAGLSVLKIGEDAIVDLDKFGKQTKDKKDFRSRNKKLEKEGYKLEKISPPLSGELLAELQQISDEWLSLPGRRERSFSLGYFDQQQLVDDTVYVLVAPDKRKIAFVNQVRSYAPGEVSIDLMRHRNDVPNGTMDYLFVKLLLALHGEGFKRFSLGLAALSGVGESKDASLEEKTIHQIYEHMNRFFSYKGLRRYKSKFDPFWEARYLVYEGAAAGLVKTTLAILRVAEPE